VSTARPVVCFPFVGDVVGGSHRSAMPLISALEDHGFKPIVIVHRDGPLTQELDQLGIAWEPAPTRTSFGAASRTGQFISSATAAWPLSRMLRSRDADIVHTNDARMHRTWNLAARLSGTSHVWHQRNAGLSWKMTQIARSADAILAVSEFTRASLPRHLARRTRVIDNPFNVTPPLERAHARGQLANELGDAMRPYVVAFAGMFIDRKRPLLFVDIAAHLIERGVDAVFPMFGAANTELAKTVERSINDRGLAHRIRFMGFRTPVEPWLAACDALVAPSVAEPFARTVVEAMIVGTPVIASDDGGNREIIVSRTNGLLVEPDNAEAFADEAARLMANKLERQRLADNARQVVERRFSIDQHVTAVGKIYAEILA